MAFRSSANRQPTSNFEAEGRKPQVKRKRVSTPRAQFLLRQLIENSEVIGHAPVRRTQHGRERQEVFLLVSIDAEDFDRLCTYGADAEDMEDDDPPGAAVGEDDENDHVVDYHGAPTSGISLDGDNPAVKRAFELTPILTPKEAA